MSKKKCLKSKTKRSGKESKNTVSQRNKEMIDEYELCIRSAITGNKKYFFIAYLMLYYGKQIHHVYADNLIGLATCIYKDKKLYITTHGKYKLMEFSSIVDNLRTYSKQIREEFEQEKKEKKRLHSKK